MMSREDVAVAQAAGLSGALISVFYVAGMFASKLGFILVGLLIIWRKSNDWVALALSLLLMLWTTEGIENLGAWMPVIQVLYAADICIFLLLPFIFPNGRFVPGWTRWFAIPFLLVGILSVVLPALSLPDQLFGVLFLAPYTLWFIVAGYAVVYRYRRVSNAIERQQTKWVMVGILSTFVIFFPYAIVTAAFPPSQPSLARLVFVLFVVLPINILAYLLVPAAIAFAILRYRLWDIDIVIRKTLTYALVVGVLALVYFGSIVLLQQLFAFLSNQRSEWITVISTLAIAALFVPVRNRIQSAVDHRFYRKKYDSQRVLQEFGTTVRDETDLEKLTGRLRQVVDETMQPKSVTIWLTPSKEEHPGA